MRSRSLVVLLVAISLLLMANLLRWQELQRSDISLRAARGDRAAEPLDADGSPQPRLASPDRSADTSFDDLQSAAADDAEYHRLLRMFVDTLDQVEQGYVQNVSRRELMEAAIDGMLSKLDQHSDYISPDEIDGFRTDVEAEFGGIGIQVAKPSPQHELSISRALPGTPAQQAGIGGGDVITHIDGAATDGLSLSDAVMMLKGLAGTSVEITVRHPDGAIEPVDVEREVIRVDTVLGVRRNSDGSWNYLVDEPHKLAYVQITAFARHTHEDLRRVLEELEQQGMRGLVLDLRLNPGGLLTAAIDVSDLFISSGEIVRTAGRNVSGRTFLAHAAGTFDGFPMAVLVNRYSASASEIAAACLQDHERAVIIGERTYGKGSVQNVIDLDEGRSALKLTTAHYVRPNGQSIHRLADAGEEDDWGVKPTPGFEVPQTLRDVRQLALVHAQRQGAIADDRLLPNFHDVALEKAIAYLTDTSREAKGSGP